MKNSVGCIIQARTDSKRLPGKILYKINNVTILEILITRLKTRYKKAYRCHNQKKE